MIILSNNSEEAIQVYLNHQRLAADITVVVGRARGNPEFVKRDPYAVEQALQQAGDLPARVAFIGDAIIDVEIGPEPAHAPSATRSTPDEVNSSTKLEQRPSPLPSEQRD